MTEPTVARDRPPVLCLMGPTASGKTGLAVELVQRLPFEIISVDSAMIYRGMDIGTAKPGPEVLERAPHHLIDILDPAERYSAARFREDALALMEQIRARGGLPLLVGGTSLYFRALQQGLSELPEADPTCRAELEEQAAREGWEALHQELARVDPAAARRIHPNDPQRIGRALEVYRLTGRPLSDWFREGRGAEGPYRFVNLALAPPERGVLHQRIAERFRSMLEQGLVDEVRAFHARPDLHPGLPSMRAVGYRQVWSWLEGECSETEMVERGIAATRQYAKRQLTWLRGEADLTWLDPASPGLADRLANWWEAGGEHPFTEK
jgi:tRNA dimethylallyltransferase